MLILDAQHLRWIKNVCVQLQRNPVSWSFCRFLIVLYATEPPSQSRFCVVGSELGKCMVLWEVWEGNGFWQGSTETWWFRLVVWSLLTQWRYLQMEPSLADCLWRCVQPMWRNEAAYWYKDHLTRLGLAYLSGWMWIPVPLSRQWRKWVFLEARWRVFWRRGQVSWRSKRWRDGFQEGNTQFKDSYKFRKATSIRRGRCENYDSAGANSLWFEQLDFYNIYPELSTNNDSFSRRFTKGLSEYCFWMIRVSRYYNWRRQKNTPTPELVYLNHNFFKSLEIKRVKMIKSTQIARLDGIIIYIQSARRELTGIGRPDVMRIRWWRTGSYATSMYSNPPLTLPICRPNPPSLKSSPKSRWSCEGWIVIQSLKQVSRAGHILYSTYSWGWSNIIQEYFLGNCQANGQSIGNHRVVFQNGSRALVSARSSYGANRIDSRSSGTSFSKQVLPKEFIRQWPPIPGFFMGSQKKYNILGK